MKRNVNNISEVEFDFMGFRCVGKSIERLLGFGFEIFNNADDFVIAASSINPRGR